MPNDTKPTTTAVDDDSVAAAERVRLAGIERLRQARAEQAEVHSRTDQDRTAVDRRVTALEREFAEAEAAEQRERQLAAARERHAAAVEARRPVAEQARQLHDALVGDPANATPSDFLAARATELERVQADQAVRAALQGLANVGEGVAPERPAEARLSRFRDGDPVGMLAAAACALWPQHEALREVRPVGPRIGVRFG